MTEAQVLARTGGTVRDHQQRTVANYLRLRDMAPELPIIPVLQGQSISDYQRCAHSYERHGVDLAALPLVGVGSVCRRQHTPEVEQILRALAARGYRLHAFGAKVLGLGRFADAIASSDSAAWSFRGRYVPGCTPTHRSEFNCQRFALAWHARLQAALRAEKPHDSQNQHAPANDRAPPLTGRGRADRQLGPAVAAPPPRHDRAGAVPPRPPHSPPPRSGPHDLELPMSSTDDDFSTYRGFYPDGLTPEAITAVQRDVDRELRRDGYPVRHSQPPATRRSVRGQVEPGHDRASNPTGGTPPAATTAAPRSCAPPLPGVSGQPGDTGAADDTGPATGHPAGDPVPTLFTPAQAADLLQVPESWLRRRAARRLVPCTFLGKHLRFSRANLHQILAEATRPAARGSTPDTGAVPRRRGRAPLRTRTHSRPPTR